jgi:hypothetical protein
MPKKKGTKKTGGRVAGTPNTTTKSVKQAIMNAYLYLGGDQAFGEWATEEKTEFYKLYAKLLPLDVNHLGNITININKTVD